MTNSCGCVYGDGDDSESYQLSTDHNGDNTPRLEQKLMIDGNAAT